MHTPIARVALMALLVAPLTGVQAASVYLNGVRIDGVTNQRFDKATVRIDEKGDVFIEAVGYSVKVEPTTAVPPPRTGPTHAGRVEDRLDKPATLTRRYWLITEQTAPGMTEYDVDLYINSKWIRKMRNDDEQLITEITRHLTPGRNSVVLLAKKVATGPRRSFSPEHVFRVVIGEGNVGGQNVMIDEPVVKFERTAADNKDVSQEFTFTTR